SPNCPLPSRTRRVLLREQGRSQVKTLVFYGYRSLTLSHRLRREILRSPHSRPAPSAVIMTRPAGLVGDGTTGIGGRVGVGGGVSVCVAVAVNVAVFVAVFDGVGVLVAGSVAGGVVGFVGGGVVVG